MLKEIKAERLACLSLFAFFLFLYSFFQSPGINGGDAGDLVVAAALRGVAHPPGYPLYTLLGWVLTKLPIGPTVAYRVGLLSSISSVFSVLLAFLIAKKLSRNLSLSLVATLALAFNYHFWLQAEVQEVFALHLFFLFLVMYLVLQWFEKPHPRIIFFLALITGLEFAHHHTFILIFPALAYLFFVDRKTRISKKLFNRRLVLKALLFFLIGASFYLYVPWASASNPPINWGLVHDLRSFLRLVIRADYGTFTAAKSVPFSFKDGILAVLTLAYSLYHEFTLVGMVLIFLGAFGLFKSKKPHFYFTFIWFFFTGPFFQLYASFPINDWFDLATVERFYLMAYPALFVWWVWGLIVCQRKIKQLLAQAKFLRPQSKNLLTLTSLLFFALIPFFLFWTNFKKVDFRNFYEFDKFGERILSSCSPNSVFIAGGGDVEIFALLSTHHVYHLRPNIKIVSFFSPRMAIFHHDEFSQFRPYFQGPSYSPEEFWSAFIKYLLENNLPVCTTGKLNISDERKKVPNGLVDVYTQTLELGGKDYELIFQKNKLIWDRYQTTFSLEESPWFETYFNQELLDAYYHRLFDISQFFFAGGEYEKARFWLDKAREYRPGAENLLRVSFLIDVKENNCGLAKEKLEKNRLVFEEAATWPMIEAIYEKECLGKEEKYKQLEESLL
jgi:hypothetical protein